MTHDIKKFYKRDCLEKMMFGYVSGLVSNIPIPIEKAILNFMKFHNVTEEEMNLNTAKMTFYRMQKEYYDTKRESDGSNR